MHNPLTFRVESWLGSVMLAAFAGFLVGLLWLSIRNFGSEADILNASRAQVHIISTRERELIARWAKDQGLSTTQIKYRELINQYPDRPWETEILDRTNQTDQTQPQ